MLFSSSVSEPKPHETLSLVNNVYPYLSSRVTVVASGAAATAEQRPTDRRCCWCESSAELVRLGALQSPSASAAAECALAR